MAHRTGRRDRLVGPLRGLLLVAGDPGPGAAVARVLPGRPRGLVLFALLVVAAGGLLLVTGPAGQNRDALAAISAGAAPGTPQASEAPFPVAAGPASAIDSLAGSSGIDPLDLI